MTFSGHTQAKCILLLVNPTDRRPNKIAIKKSFTVFGNLFQKNFPIRSFLPNNAA
jgi:hypothetical protein